MVEKIGKSAQKVLEVESAYHMGDPRPVMVSQHSKTHL